MMEFSQILVLIVSCDLVQFIAKQNKTRGSDIIHDLEQYHIEGN